nr:sigma factor [Kibdelosporangium sp. MJ126-NF4]
MSAGSHAAFEVLFRRHLRAVWNYAYRLSGSADVAEDLTSNAFLTAWRKRKQVVLIRESAQPWLLTVVGNLARDEYKSARRRLRLIRRAPPPVPVPDHSESTVARLDDRQRYLETLSAIRRLPSAQRQAVELCLLGELPQAEAAEILGVSVGTVRSHISRARARLRTELAQQQEASHE